MTDAQRGNTKHGPRLDEELEQETRGMVQGAPGGAHVEPFRETEPLPDDTDAPEVEDALRRDEEGTGDGSAEGDETTDGQVATDA